MLHVQLGQHDVPESSDRRILPVIGIEMPYIPYRIVATFFLAISFLFSCYVIPSHATALRRTRLRAHHARNSNRFRDKNQEENCKKIVKVSSSLMTYLGKSVCKKRVDAFCSYFTRYYGYYPITSYLLRKSCGTKGLTVRPTGTLNCCQAPSETSSVMWDERSDRSSHSQIAPFISPTAFLFRP